MQLFSKDIAKEIVKGVTSNGIYWEYWRKGC
jgi:hypothetical protein